MECVVIPCANPVRHQPTYLRTVKHHIKPQMWGGPDTPENLVRVCDVCHYGAHVLLDMAVKLNRWLSPAEVPPGASRFVVALAKRGFLSRPVGPVLPTLYHERSGAGVALALERTAPHPL